MLGWLKNRKVNKAIDDALRDGVISRNELAAIGALAEEAGLGQGEVSALMVEKVRPIAQRLTDKVVERVLATRRFSLDDEAELLAIRDQLYLAADVNYESLMPFRFLWQIEHGIEAEPPMIDAPIRLSGGELCHFAAAAGWRQWKTVRENRGYAGGSVRVRVAKGVSVSLGRAVPVTGTREELQLVSDGMLVITSARLVFVGNRRSTEIKQGAIAAVVPYSDAVEIQKSRGVPEIFTLPGHQVELAQAVLAALPSR